MSEYTEAIEIVTENAMRRFAEWRGAHIQRGAALPPDPTDALQVRLCRAMKPDGWPLLPADAERDALLVITALGEVFEAGDGDPAVAALGKVLVHAGNVAMRFCMALGELLAAVPFHRDPNVGPGCTPVGAAGYFARAIADGPDVFGIKGRGVDQVLEVVDARLRAYRHNIVGGLVGAIAAALDHVEINSAEGAAVDLFEVYRIVAGEFLGQLGEAAA